MTDDLVKRLHWHRDFIGTNPWPDGYPFLREVRDRLGDAADRIETLTAERDHAWAMVAKADTQVGQSLADNLQAKAERDRLREALQQFLIEYDEVDLAHAEPSSLTAAVLEARAALKGETP